MATTQNEPNSHQYNAKPTSWTLLITVVVMLLIDFMFVSALRGSSSEALGIYIIFYAIFAPMLATGILRANLQSNWTSIAVIVFVTLLATTAKYLILTVVRHAG